MKADVSIIDYGINNLKSVSKAFEKIGKTTEIIDTPEKILKAKCLILPGIGAFENGMEGLRRRNLIDSIRKKVEEKTPLLGICLGMQMLFSVSEEFGKHDGLDLIKGKVIALKRPEELKIKDYKVPHMGWNELDYNDKKKESWNNTALMNTKEKSNVYFVHSFYPIPAEKTEIVATTEYGNQTIYCVVKKDNITGMQFHPEKSGEIGLEMLKTFCKLNKI